MFFKANKFQIDLLNNNEKNQLQSWDTGLTEF